MTAPERRVGTEPVPERGVDAVVFDWGGTLTPWHDVDLMSQWYAYADVYDPVHARFLAAALLEAEDACWRRQRETAGAESTGALQRVFEAAGVDTESPRHADALAAYLAFWDPHTYADPDAAGLLQALRDRGMRVGVLSNTMWPREHHEAVFARDGLAHLIDAGVYTSELPVGKPHADAFRAALDAVGVTDPARAVYVGDRAYEDVHGAQSVGMRAILLPHSTIPAYQQVPLDVVPDAVVQRLGDVLDVVDGWVH